jgi:hypothetical protein
VLAALYDIKNTPVMIPMLSNLQPWGLFEMQIQNINQCGCTTMVILKIMYSKKT